MSYGWLVLSACLHRLNGGYIVSLCMRCMTVKLSHNRDSAIFWRSENAVDSNLVFSPFFTFFYRGKPADQPVVDQAIGLFRDIFATVAIYLMRLSEKKRKLFPPSLSLKFESPVYIARIITLLCERQRSRERQALTALKKCFVGPAKILNITECITVFFSVY